MNVIIFFPYRTVLSIHIDRQYYLTSAFLKPAKHDYYGQSTIFVLKWMDYRIGILFRGVAV